MSCSGLIPEGRLLAAFSGGEDSLYMLMLLAREAGERTEAAYVDHGIRSRAELEREIGLNRENAARLGIRLHIITLAPGAVAALAREKGLRVLDADCVVEAQAPKLGPARDEMRRNLADALGIDEASVGVKATTTERLGYTGREEGIRATAVVLLEGAEA